jgi:hypothetical protein
MDAKLVCQTTRDENILEFVIFNLANLVICQLLKDLLG